MRSPTRFAVVLLTFSLLGLGGSQAQAPDRADAEAARKECSVS